MRAQWKPTHQTSCGNGALFEIQIAAEKGHRQHQKKRRLVKIKLSRTPVPFYLQKLITPISPNNGAR
jgi:hypothetical protein